MNHRCTDCRRHATHHADLFNLLPAGLQDQLQIQLCDSAEGGSCPGDPFGPFASEVE